MIFFLDSDMPDKTSIIESDDWKITPDLETKTYDLYVNSEHVYNMTPELFKRIYNAVRGNIQATKVYLTKTSVTFDY